MPVIVRNPGMVAPFHGAISYVLLLAGALVASTAVASTNDPLDWWSLRPLAHADPPSPKGLPKTWAQSPIDRFVFAKLAEKGLKPSPPAERRALIRRVTYDLTGLPPAPEDIEAFVKDTRPGAYEALIDRLLASPHYGEHWGRHWLDVIRFGESRGFERNEIINTAWPFRDYVIRSFNEDKPFNQLVVEHLAGDVIGKGDPAVEVGTTFLVDGPYDDVGNQDPVQAQLIRANTIDEIITATSGAFLGLTVNCARCHNHKFDPITAEDYYRFYAIFAGVFHGERTLAAPEQQRQREDQLKPLEARRAAAAAAIREFESGLLQRADSIAETNRQYTLPKVDPHLTEDRFAPVNVRFVRLTIESNNRDPRSGANAHLDEFEVWSAEATPRNVALASAGARVEAPKRQAEDFMEAYAPSLVIDGAYGARWISPGAGALTITLPRAERIDRVAFSADRRKALPAASGEIVFVGEYFIETSLDGTNWAKAADSRERPPLNDAFVRERQLRAAMTPADQQRRAELERELGEASAAISRVPSLPQVWVGRFEQPKETVHVMKGGDPQKKGAEVRPASLSTLAQVTPGFALAADAPESERRLALAQWLVREDNPLTARVLANRLWHYHFGTGIVDTPSDFGKLGGLPTHPELLDWLARRVQHHGWKLKAMHREILLSQAYQQSAKWREEASKIDADSRLLWRFPPRRFSAEEIRDTLLSVAGVLDPRAGGPGFKLYRYLQDNVATYLPLDRHGPETYRRAVYHHNARASVVDLMTEFDMPDCAFATPRRAATTSPLQALTLLNHRFTLDMAEALARRVTKETGADDHAAQVQRALVLAFGRPTTAGEIKEGVKFVQRQSLAAYCRALLNANELIHVE